MNLPLSFNPIATTSSAEETESLFSDQLIRSRIMKAESQRTFGVEMNGVTVGDCILSTVHHKTDYDIDCGEVDNEDSVIFTYSNGSPSSTSFSGREVCNNNNGCVITRHSKLSHRRTAGSYEFIINCSREAIEHRLQSSLDRYASKQLVFDESVSMHCPSGRHAQNTMTYIINSVEADPSLLESSILSKNLEELLLDAVLRLPSNYSEQLGSLGEASLAPGIVIKAEAFMEGNAHLPITMSDLLAQCGGSRSELFKNFRRFRGYTPWEFLTSRRLELAHHRLLNASEQDNVTRVAHELGFTHMGRFSAMYRKRFGKKPSETLRG